MTTLKPATAKKEVLEMGKLINKGALKSWELLAAAIINKYLDVDSFKSLDLLTDKKAVDKFHTVHLRDLSKIVGEMLNLYYVASEKPYVKVETVLNELLNNGVFTNWVSITGCNFGNFDNELGDSSLFEFHITYKGHSYRFTSENSAVEKLHGIVPTAKIGE